MTKQEVIERIGYVKALVSESYTISNTEESEQWDKIDSEFGELVNMVKQLEEKSNTCIHGKTLISECGLCQMDMDDAIIDDDDDDEDEEEDNCNCPSMAEDMGIENLPLSNKEDMD